MKKLLHSWRTMFSCLALVVLADAGPGCGSAGPPPEVPETGAAAENGEA